MSDNDFERVSVMNNYRVFSLIVAMFLVIFLAGCTAPQGMPSSQDAASQTTTTAAATTTTTETTEPTAYVDDGSVDHLRYPYQSRYMGVSTDFVWRQVVTKPDFEDWTKQFESEYQKSPRSGEECTLRNFLLELKIPKESAVQVLLYKEDGTPQDSPQFTREEIDILYSDDMALVNRTFKNDYALYHNGKLYTYEWLEEHSLADYEKENITIAEVKELMQGWQDNSEKQAMQNKVAALESAA